MHTNRCVRWALALSLTCTAAVAQAATVWVGRFPAGAAGLPEPARDVRLLLAHALGQPADRLMILLDKKDPLGLFYAKP